MIYDLPTTLEFGGKEWEINTDYRDILNILVAFEDVELTDKEKAYVCLYNMYPDFESIPQDQLQAAYDAAIEFIDHGHKDDKRTSKKTMDWEYDADIIFPAVNHVAGIEVRAVDYMHWWTFLGYFMEIRDDTAATVFSLRQKKARGKKLEKYEQEYWNQNRAICEIKTKYTEEEQAEQDELKRLLGLGG